MDQAEVYTHVYNHDVGGIADEDIPAFCADHAIDVLITSNVRDFGARKTIYALLLESGIHVVVVRLGKQKPTIEAQMAAVTLGISRLTTLLDEANEPILVRLTASGDCARRGLDELLAEIEGAEQRTPLP